MRLSRRSFQSLIYWITLFALIGIGCAKNKLPDANGKQAEAVPEQLGAEDLQQSLEGYWLRTQRESLSRTVSIPTNTAPILRIQRNRAEILSNAHFCPIAYELNRDELKFIENILEANCNPLADEIYLLKVLRVNDEQLVLEVRTNRQMEMVSFQRIDEAQANDYLFAR